VKRGGIYRGRGIDWFEKGGEFVKIAFQTVTECSMLWLNVQCTITQWF
jgi:hypothetical protein